MKEFKNLMIIGVDHGYGNIKTAGTVTKNGVTAYETEPIFSGNILEYGGMYYRIGDCHKEFIPDKAAHADGCGKGAEPVRHPGSRRSSCGRTSTHMDPQTAGRIPKLSAP